MRNFVVITIPKHLGRETFKLEYEVLEGFAEQLDKYGAKIVKYDVLPYDEKSLVHRVLVLVDSSEPIQMVGYSEK